MSHTLHTATATATAADRTGTAPFDRQRDLSDAEPSKARASKGAGGKGDEGKGGQLAQFLPYQLSIASNAVSDLIAERYRERFGLKIMEWRVMAVLGDHSREHIGTGMTQRALTEAILTDKVAINRACKVLENRGLIARAPNETDGRSHLMVLTQQGWEIHREVLPLALQTEGELLADFSAGEQEQLRTMLERLRLKVEDLT